MFKFLLTILISFVSFHAFVQEEQPKEKQILFPEYKLEDCLKNLDIKKTSKRRSAKTLSRSVQRIMADVFPLLEEDQWDEALLLLDQIKGLDKATDTDLAQMWYYYAYVHFSQDNLRLAKYDYQQFLAIPDTDPRLKAGVIFSLAQIAYSSEDYRETIKRLKEWLALEEAPSSTGFDIMAAAHWQLKEKKLALKNAETAMCISKANQKIPREGTYNLLVALYNEVEDTLSMLSLYEELVGFYPKKRYWVQLSGIYGELKEESKQLGALEAAHDQRLLDKENEYVVLYQLLMRAEAPFKAAKVIDYGIRQEFVEENEKHLKYLAQAWHLSQELDKAEPVYKKAAEKAKDGELFVFLGQIYLATDRLDLASESLKKGLEKGKLKDPVSVNILLGQVAYEQQKFDEATTFFRKSLDKVSDVKGKNEEDTFKKQDKLRNQALKWLTYTENERERVRILNLRRKDLEENA